MAYKKVLAAVNGKQFFIPVHVVLQWSVIIQVLHEEVHTSIALPKRTSAIRSSHMYWSQF